MCGVVIASTKIQKKHIKYLFCAAQEFKTHQSTCSVQHRKSKYSRAREGGRREGCRVREDGRVRSEGGGQSEGCKVREE